MSKTPISPRNTPRCGCAKKKGKNLELLWKYSTVKYFFPQSKINSRAIFQMAVYDGGMITTQLYRGQGLGNQLWSYVVLRVLAKDKGYAFGIQTPENFKGAECFDLDFGEKITGGSGPEGGPPITLPAGIAHYYEERKVTHPRSGADIRVHDATLLEIQDGTKIDGCFQDEKYISHRKEDIRKWLTLKKDADFRYGDENTCIINFRGGGYVGDDDLFLPRAYWDNAMRNMREKVQEKHPNTHLKFAVITDDPVTARKFFAPDIPVHHFSIGKDYAAINNARYLILSNSSFAWFPAWLNENLKFCIAPKYWARHNVSDGYWCLGYNITSGWHYQDTKGELFDSEECVREAKAYEAKHPEWYASKTIAKNFLVVSNHNNDLDWVPKYAPAGNYMIYDRSDAPNARERANIPREKIRVVPNVGYNLRDYFSFLVEHYDALPDCTIFAKGNIFTRHISRAYFEKIMNNEFFTPIEEYRLHSPALPKGFTTSDGGFCEANTSAYISHNHPTKYFNNYNDFLKFCFRNPALPPFVRFAPGGMYIVPKAHILKLPKVFYENLILFLSHAPLPGEAHIIERALYTLWTANFDLHENMLAPVDTEKLALAFRAARQKKKTRLEYLKNAIPLSVRKRIPAPAKALALQAFGHALALLKILNRGKKRVAVLAKKIAAGGRERSGNGVPLWMTRSELINRLIQKYGYRSYLEIGVNTPAQPGFNFDSVNIALKHGVDPEKKANATFPLPSDEFFAHHISRKYDIIFVDGLHLAEQAYRDIMNALHWLNENGTIVVHDCNPTSEKTQERVHHAGAWHGDVWKAILKLRMENPDLEIYTVNTDEGVAIIRRAKPGEKQKLFEMKEKEKNKNSKIQDIADYAFFNTHRKEILHLISVKEFKRKMEEKT